MQLICLGLSHHNAPVELRECLSLSGEMIERAFKTVPIRSGAFEAVMEMAVLSTCNRLEVYAVLSTSNEISEPPEAAFQCLQKYLQEGFSFPVEQVGSYFQMYAGIRVVEHLFQVAAGLDSIAIGEPQILGQVSRALETAMQWGGARHVLSSLFRSAIHAGKRVQSETEIGRHPTSISSIAVELGAERFAGLSGRKCLVIGAGKMGAAALQALQEQGAGEIQLINRTDAHAAALAAQTGTRALPYAELEPALEAADLVFTSTAAPQPILRADLVARVMARRSQRALILIDLAVPRNIEPGVKNQEHVQLFDMDDLQDFVKRTRLDGQQALGAAHRIVMDEVSEYEKLLRIIPFIGELHKKVELIRQREVEKTLRNLRSSDAQVNEQIEILSRALVRKILHEPTMHLRTETNQETLNDYVDTLARLFDLSEGGTSLTLESETRWES
jgi:glutamyl-tRNA reductase